MSEKKFALIIANFRYEDARFNQLVAPVNDAVALANVLKNPDIGNFEVKTLFDQPSYKLKLEIQEFFLDRKRDDLLLLYFSGHGMKDENGELYYCVTDTLQRRLQSTAIEANFVNRMMRESISKKQIMVLDCCHSGAVWRGMKGTPQVGTWEVFQGRGRVVLTASDAMQYAFEARKILGAPAVSVFTSLLVRGLETGEAGKEGKDLISVQDLYEYVHGRIADEGSKQTPTIFQMEGEGSLYIARNISPKPVVQTLKSPEQDVDLKKQVLSVDRLIEPKPKRRLINRKRLQLFLFLVILIFLNSTISRLSESWDVGSNSWFARFGNDKAIWQLQRGAAIMDHPNQFGDQYSSVRYLSQGWSPGDSMSFYNTPLGSDLIPYDFFMSLAQPGTESLFRSNDNLFAFGFLPQTPTRSNRDGLPVGFVKDTYLGKDYLGFSCAACHTAQVNYKGIAMRIDGGPAGSDLDAMLQKLAEAMQATLEDKTARASFEKRVIERGNYSSANAVDADLENFAQRLTTYEIVNRSPIRYGYFRLDGFGRIYNRVLEHIVTQDQLNEAMEDLVKDGQFTQQELDALRQDKKTSILTGEQRDNLVFRLFQVLPLKAQIELRNKLFNPSDAPVSYPFLWDTPQHDYVQWNGMIANVGLGSLIRNTNEAIGYFATLDWGRESGFSLSSFASGQGFKSSHVNFKSSINVHNLRRLEHRLESLQSPQWPEDILPPIDRSRTHKGEVLFAQFCAVCHTNIDRSDPDRRVIAQMTSLKNVRTDPKMAVNAITHDGLSGFLRNQYVTAGPNVYQINQRERVAALLTTASLNVVATPSPNKSFVRRGLDWADDLVEAFTGISSRPSAKQGKYDSDTTADPYASLLSYKARSLNGIWATAPYLHNGSVPTLYDLLLPPNPEDAKNPSAAAECRPVLPGIEYRPCKFMVGSREFDPEKVGLKSSGYDGFVFNTKLPGNSNAGHEYGTKVLTKEDRLNLLEYLKTL